MSDNVDCSWRTPPYWPQPQVRAETAAMAQIICDVLLANTGADEISAVYHKGSAQKPWATVLDYVPEISDIDVHVRFADDATAARFGGSYELALTIRRQIAERYEAAHPRTLHYPRPQLIVVNGKDFLPTPAWTVATLYGEAYKAADLEALAGEFRTRGLEAIAETREFASHLPGRLMDRPGPYVRELLRLLSWRVSPLGPTILLLSGTDVGSAWSATRTEVVARLHDLGRGEAANAYRDYYLHCWDYVLSGRRDSEAGVAAINSAATLFQLAGQVMDEHGDSGRRTERWRC